MTTSSRPGLGRYRIKKDAGTLLGDVCACQRMDRTLVRDVSSLTASASKELPKVDCQQQYLGEVFLSPTSGWTRTGSKREANTNCHDKSRTHRREGHDTYWTHSTSKQDAY